MHFEKLVIVTGLADDHAAVREALTAAAKLVLGTSASVMDPSVPPVAGFAMVLAMPGPVAAAALVKLREALAAELDRRDVMHAELAVELLTEAET